MVSHHVASTVVYIAPFIIGPLSLCSSAAIVFLLLQPVNRNMILHRPKEQFLLGLSLLDICSSFALSFSTLPSPKSSPNSRLESYVTMGTIGTCEAQGFLVQMGYGAPLYNAAIAIYFVLSVIFKVPDRTLMRRLVPACHVIIATFCLATSVTGLVLHFYNNAGMMGCWIHDAGGFRTLCREEGVHCDRVNFNYVPFEIGFGIVPVSLSLAIVISSMFALTIKVYITERPSSRFSFRQISPAKARLDASSTNRACKDAATCAMGTELPLTQRTIETGLLYSLTLILIYVPMGTLALELYSTTEARLVMRMFAAILTPSQGLFNLLVFTSPQWLDWLHRRRFCDLFSSCCVSVFCCCGLLLPRKKRAGYVEYQTEELNLSSEQGSLEQQRQITTHNHIFAMHSPSVAFGVESDMPCDMDANRGSLPQALKEEDDAPEET